ncbi:NAD(P)/FAD-dependent oxidoreductase [Rhodococcus wratislaviensis]|nr:FAD-dependent oxidoreductase [Rhodococcus wratislaviensis]
MVKRQRVVIVGGGAIGLAAGYFLQKEGAEVVVLERGRIGDGASYGNAGWITPMLSAPLPAPGVRRQVVRTLGRSSSPVSIAPRLDPGLAMWLWRFWRHCSPRAHAEGLRAMGVLNRRTMSLFDELRRDQVEFSMWQKGLLFAFLTAGGARAALSELAALADLGYLVPQSVMGSEELRHLEPSLSPQVAAGYLLSEERHVEPQTLVQGLADRISRDRAIVRERVDVTDFEVRGRRVVAARAHGERIEADQFLLAAGAWTRPLGRKLGLRVPIQGAKGYSFGLRTEQPPLHPLYLGDSKVGVSSFSDGRVRVVGAMELSGLNTDIEEQRVTSLLEKVRKFIPGAGMEDVYDVWTGIRPLSHDGLPIVGASNEYDNVFLSTGHAMLGITLAPATGEALAELMTTGSGPELLRPFSPARFRTS